MAFIPAPNVCQAELIYNWSGQIVETVLHFEATGTLDPAKMDELGEFLVDWWDTSMQTSMVAEITLTGVKLTDLTSNIAPVLNYASGLPLTGSAATPTMPNNVALVFTKRTLLRGRSYRGRIFHPGLGEIHVTGNNAAGGVVSSFVGIYGQLIDFTTASESWNMVVVSRFTNNAPRVTADSNQVIGITSDGVIDSQRRRLPGRGN